MKKHLKEVYNREVVSNIPNALIEASYKYNLSGERIKLLIFTKVSQFHFLRDPPIKVRIKTDEYAFHFNISENAALNSLKLGIESIIKSPVLFNGCTERIPMVDKFSITKDDGLVMILNQEFLLKCSGAEALFDGSLFGAQGCSGDLSLDDD